MYIWNGESDLWDQISKNDDFRNFIENELDISKNLRNYIDGNIVSFVYKKDIFSEPFYENKQITIQNLYPLKDNIDIAYFYLSYIVNRLYRLSFKEFYNKEFEESYSDYIYNVFIKIKDKYKEKLSNETFIQAVRNIIQTDIEFKGLNIENQEFIINLLKETIKNGNE